MRFLPSRRRASNPSASVDVEAAGATPASVDGATENNNGIGDARRFDPTAIIRRLSRHHSNHPGAVDENASDMPSTGRFGKPRKANNTARNIDQNESNADQGPAISPYALYANEELSPRSSAWLYMSAASIAGLSSFLITDDSIDDGDRRTVDKLLITLLGISFALSLLVTISYRHRGLRGKLTSDIRFARTSLEFILAILTLGMWCVVLRYVADQSSGLNYGMSMLTIDGYDEVWNTNIWLSTWLGWGLATYLVGSMFMASAERKKGVCALGYFKQSASRSSQYRYNRSESDQTPRAGNLAGNNTANTVNSEAQSQQNGESTLNRSRDQGECRLVYWFMVLSFSLALATFSIKMRTGEACASVLSGTPFCRRLSLAGSVGILCAMLAVIWLVLFRLDQMGKFDNIATISRIETVIAFFALALNSINMGFSSSPSGPTTQMGNLFVSTTMGTILSLLLCEQVLNDYMPKVPPSTSLENERWVEDVKIDNTDGLGVEGGNNSSKRKPSDSSSSSSSDSSSDSSSSSDEDTSAKDTASRKRTTSSNNLDTSSTTQDKSDVDSSYVTTSISSNFPSVKKDVKVFVSKPLQKKHSSGTAARSQSSSYSLPKPAPTYASSSPSPQPSKNPAAVSSIQTAPPPLSNSTGPGSRPGYSSSSSLPQSSNMASANVPFQSNRPPLSNSEVAEPSPQSSSYQPALDGQARPASPVINQDVKPYSYSMNDSDGDESGVQLDFIPDDVSTLGESIMTGADPDGYKSEDAYSSPMKTDKPQQKKNFYYHRRDNRGVTQQGHGGFTGRVLPPVEEQSPMAAPGTTTPLSQPSSPTRYSTLAKTASPNNDSSASKQTTARTSSTTKAAPIEVKGTRRSFHRENSDPTRTIEEIMTRGMDRNSASKSIGKRQISWHGDSEGPVQEEDETSPRASSKSKATHQTSWYEEDTARVRQIARGFSRAAASGNNDSSHFSGGPPTVNSEDGKKDEVVQRTLRSNRTFYSDDSSVETDGIVHDA